MAAPTQVRCLHLLIKDCESRNPKSFRDPEGQRIKSTTRAQAIQNVEKLREVIVSGQYKFEDVAYSYSDCSSAKSGGDLGFFERGAMQKPFEDAAFALEVGQVSGIVLTDSGVHIIKRIA